MSTRKTKNKLANYLKIILPLSFIIPVSFFLLLLVLSQHSPKTPTASTDESYATNTETTETEEATETESVAVSYVDQIALDYVAQPVARTQEEAIAKIYELSSTYPDLARVYENADQYPIELLLSGANNPEMTDYLCGYLDSDGSITGGFTEEEQPEDYPLFLQFDPRWGYLSYGTRGTVGSSGCGPTCLSMAIFYLTGDRTCTPGTASLYSLDNGYYVEGVGTSWSLLTDYPAQFGLNSYQISRSEENLKAELDKGRILICSVRPGDFTSGGHFILIYGYDENGFKINDPKCVYRSRLSWTYQQIQDDIKATWTIGH